MKRRIFTVMLALCLVSLLAVSVMADGSIAGHYAAVSCERDGEKYNCDTDYLELEADGTGVVAFNGEPVSMLWKLDGDRFYLEDADGCVLSGLYQDGKIVGNYGGYDYVYALSSEADSAYRYCPAIACERNGNQFSVKGRYMLFYPNGKGMVSDGRYAYFMEWTAEGDEITFTDHMGKTMQGTVTADRITGSYRGCDYVWEISGETAPIMNFAPSHWDADLPYVYDQADILTDGEESALSEKAAALTEKYHCKVYIITVDNMDRYSSANSVDAFVEQVMTGYRMGYGKDRDAIVLALSMAERDFCLMADGTFGNAAFTDYGKQTMQEHFLDNFKENDWYGGFSDYLKWCEKLMKSADAGKPYEKGQDPKSKLTVVIVAVIAGSVISMIVCLILRGKMKPVHKGTQANDYIPGNGFTITGRSDAFSHTTVDRRYSPKSESGGSGGGTSSGSSGRSSSSGKF